MAEHSTADPEKAQPVTHRRVLHIALPIVLSNATVPLLGLVDSGVVGQLGLAAPIGAVGIGAVTLAAIYWIMGFLRMGTTGMVAQARGSGEVEETGALLTRGLLIGGAAGLIFIALQYPLFAGAFWLSPASAEVESLARSYMIIRIWSAPAIIATYALTGWLIGMERTRSVLILQLWMNGLNIVLDILFVMGFNWGVEGVAFATFLAEWTGAALGLYLCREAFSGSQWRNWARVFDKARLRYMAAINIDIMIRSVLLTGSFLSFLYWGGAFGDDVLGANQILLLFLEVTAYALDGFAFAAEAMVGAALGQRNRAALRHAAIITSQWGVGLSFALGAAFYLCGPAIIDLMAKAPGVQEQARIYLPWVAAAPVIGIASWMLDGIFIGATRTAAMRNAMLISTAIYIVALLSLATTFGNHGLWAALMILNLARAITLAIRYPALEAAASRPP
ncbi:MATE family efflux transporter [Halovulum sp. GXIMD14793]